MSILAAIVFFLYIILLLLYVLVSLFIMYHLKRYSFYFRSRYFIFAFFAIGSALLLSANLLLFLSINWAGLFAYLIA